MILYCQVFIIITFYIRSRSLIQYKLNVMGVSNMFQVRFLNTDLDSL